MIIIVCGLKDLGKSYISKNLKKVMKALVYDQYTTDDNFSKILKIKDI
ncbi:MAG: Zn-dependent oxidoreductase, partial [Nitrosopumilus sp.]